MNVFSLRASHNFPRAVKYELVELVLLSSLRKIGWGFWDREYKNRTHRPPSRARAIQCLLCLQIWPLLLSLFTLSGSSTITYCSKNKLSPLRPVPKTSLSFSSFSQGWRFQIQTKTGSPLTHQATEINNRFPQPS